MTTATLYRCPNCGREWSEPHVTWNWDCTEKQPYCPECRAYNSPAEMQVWVHVRQWGTKVAFMRLEQVKLVDNDNPPQHPRSLSEVALPE